MTIKEKQAQFYRIFNNFTLEIQLKTRKIEVFDSNAIFNKNFQLVLIKILKM